MANSKPVNPKRKRRGCTIKDLPFPVPIATDQEGTNWFYYTGYLQDNHVEVKHSGDIDRLYRMGFFGKGTFSRSKPEFNVRYRSVDIPNSKGEIIHARVMSRRSYVHRLNWYLEKVGKSEEYTEYDSSEELWENTVTEKSDKGDEISENSRLDMREIKQPSTEIISQPLNQALSTEHSEVFKKFWETNSTGSKEELWEEDADFWNTDSTKIEDENITKNANIGTLQKYDKFLETNIEINENIDMMKSNISSSSKDNSGYEFVQLHRNNLITEDQNFLKEISLDKKDKNALDPMNNSLIEIPSTGINDILHTTMDADYLEINKSIKSDINIEQKHLKITCDIVPNVQKLFDEKHSEVNNSSILKTPLEVYSLNEKSTLEFDSVTTKGTTKDNLSSLQKQGDDSSEVVYTDLDSLCKSDDDDGTLFVIDDSDSEVEDKKRQRISKKKWRPVLKRDPFFVKENLHLSFEEAFFLSYGLGCLVVKDENDKSPDLTEMWQSFSNRQRNFIPNYIAYHYYRSNGWVPKTGLKFGTDFLIYKEGPAFYHGSYSVIIKMVKEDTLNDDPQYLSRDLTWTSLAGLNRLTEQVAKEVLMCYVVRPMKLSDEDLLSPKCIPCFTVKEALLSRWVSSQERERQAEEIP